MKLLYRPLFIFCSFFVFFSALYISCKKDTTANSTLTDKCKNVVCGNGGTCDSASGSCFCLSGYEGANCETVSRDKFIGNWNVFEKGSITLAAQYATTIGPDTVVTGVVISNFYNFFNTHVRATINGDSIIIPSQTLQGKIVFGKGYIYSSSTYGQFDSLSLRFEVIDTATLVVNDFGYNPADSSNPSIWNK